MTQPAKLLLLAALLAKDRIISSNAKSFLKELILRRDPRLIDLLKQFESKETGDNAFMEKIHDLIEDESQALYDELFSSTTLEMGKTLSKDERDRKQLNDEKSLIYGEVEYDSFYRVLRKINSPGGVFYDLGSGTGKAVFAARLTQDFTRCIGIEILQGLHRQACVVLDRYNTSLRQYLCSGQSQQVALYEGSFLEYDWSDGDVVFANSTCYDDDLMLSMARQAASLKPGAIFVSFTKGLESPYFEVLERKRYKMSWGPATVFIHRRLTNEGQSFGGGYRLNLLPSDSKTYDDQEQEPVAADEFDLGSNENGDDDEDDEDDEEDEEDEDKDEEDEEEDEEEADEEEEDDTFDEKATSAYSASVVRSPHSASPGRPMLVTGGRVQALKGGGSLHSPMDSALQQRKFLRGRGPLS